jgi:hypothetical protein
MSVIITGRKIGGVTDQRSSLGNDQIIRTINVGNTWNKIRVGLRMCIVPQTNITGTPKFYVGVCNSTNAAGNNGAGSRVTNHFLGMLSTSATWTFTNGAFAPFFAVAFTAVKRIGTIDTTDGANNATITASAPLLRCFLAVDIDKTNPSAVTVEFIGISNANTGVFDVSLTDFFTQLKSDPVVFTGYSKFSLSTTLTINEGTDGILNAVNISWMKTLERMEFSDVSYHVFS